jgi:hypothetical protein
MVHLDFFGLSDQSIEKKDDEEEKKIEFAKQLTNQDKIPLFMLELSLMRVSNKFPRLSQIVNKIKNLINEKISKKVKNCLKKENSYQNIALKKKLKRDIDRINHFRNQEEKYFNFNVSAKKVVDIILSSENEDLIKKEKNAINWFLGAISTQVMIEQSKSNNKQ